MCIEVFKDLSFDIPAGRSVSFVGESGSGKSIIVKQIVGLVKPDSGTIYVDKNDLSELNLNTIKNVEKIYVLKAGKIVSVGGFKELLDHNQYFG